MIKHFTENLIVSKARKRKNKHILNLFLDKGHGFYVPLSKILESTDNFYKLCTFRIDKFVIQYLNLV